MQSTTITLLTLINITSLSLNAQTPLVGTGSSYSNIFSPDTSLTYDVPGSGVISLYLDQTGFATSSPGVWDFRATGGANISILGIGTESAAQVALASNTLQFNLSQSAGGLLGSLAGSSLHYGWQAQAYFDTSGTLNYQPDTMYNISFDVNGNNGLLGSVVGVTPQFTFELIDGSGNALTSSGSGSLVNIAGVLGTGVTSGTVNLSYMTGGVAPTGTVGVRFTGDSLVGATALGIGTNFATVSNLNISATPVPEPAGAALLGAVGMIFLLRRKRSLRA